MRKINFPTSLLALICFLTACTPAEQPPLSPRFNHVFLAVADLERSIEFYTKAFDVKVTKELKALKRTDEDGNTTDVEVNMAFLKFPGQDFVFEIGERPDYQADNTRPSYAHIGIDVTNIETASERLLAAGATRLTGVTLVEGDGVAAKNAFFLGPDGETLELMQLISGAF